MRKFLTFCLAASAALLLAKPAPAQTLTMNDLGYFEARGTNVLVYNNLYNGGFYDEKFAGLEIIQRGERLATGGGIRLMNTPEQWDIFGTVSDRIVDREGNFVQVGLRFRGQAPGDPEGRRLPGAGDPGQARAGSPRGQGGPEPGVLPGFLLRQELPRGRPRAHPSQVSDA